MQSGLTTTDSESLRFFSCLYEQYWRNSSPLLHPSNNLYVQLEYAQGTIPPESQLFLSNATMTDSIPDYRIS